MFGDDVMGLYGSYSGSDKREVCAHPEMTSVDLNDGGVRLHRSKKGIQVLGENGCLDCFTFFFLCSDLRLFSVTLP